jgi:glutathione-regulated potassium-efflux system ancillary protein KefG
MKQWIDMVLEHNWAYGKRKALQNKIIFKSLQQVAIKVNDETGSDRYSILEIARALCKTKSV